MRPLKTTAIILRRTNFGEADRILQIITPQDEKIGVIAKGVRREKSKLSASVELFSESEMVIVRGKGDLGTLTSGRLIKFYSSILADYERLQFGYEVLKKVSSVAEYLAHSGLYTTTRTVLTSLDTPAVDIRLTKIWFYLHIAEILGHGLNLSRDIDGHSLHADKTYRFDIADMSFCEDTRGHFTEGHLKLLKLLKIKTPLVVAHVSGIENYLDNCLSLARAIEE